MRDTQHGIGSDTGLPGPGASNRGKKLPELVWSGAVQLALMAGAIFMVIPFLWMISTSFKPPTEVLSWPPNLVPKEPTASNYVGLFGEAPFVRFFLNSVFISTVSTVAILATSVVGGFVFGKYRFPGRDFLFLVLLATAIVPFESYIIPLYARMVRWHWINTYQGIIAPYLIMSFGIFLMRQHINSTISDELLDAARIDGCSEWRILTSIVLPLSRSAGGALGIFAFTQAWIAFMWPLLIANVRELFNMELGLTMFQFRFSTDYGLLMAGSVLSVLPMIIVFVFLRRQIIESIALTGLKS
ncbi:MAG TPA: carbohydrate ABC transporter permease [Firmicutes bacterium]|nr:carbohydrate ABC transporter permease [Bacillota bacterium]